MVFYLRSFLKGNLFQLDMRKSSCFPYDPYNINIFCIYYTYLPVCFHIKHNFSIDTTFIKTLNFRYLKHVVLRFLTSRELEARQLTRALSVLLRLSAHEEALLRDALPPRNGLSSWFPSLNT